MAGYLKRYIGKWRVKAEYDQSTNDFPRDSDGNIDSGFDDIYIQCANNIKIKHATGSVLSCYIPSKGRGSNILRTIYQDNIDKKLPTERSSEDKRYSQNLCNELVKSGTLVSAEVLDYEVCFEFKADMIEYIAGLVKAKTNGKSISPFSSKNLPKTKYTIPDDDMKLYNDAISNLPKKTVTINGKERTMVDGLMIRSLNSDFDKIISKHMPKKFDVDKDKKLKGLSGKNYIHSLGSDIWNKYCAFLKERG